MPQSSRRHVPGWIGLVGAVGSLVMVSGVSGCPGTLDPTLLTGGGGSAGGSSGGGTTGAGGAGTCTGTLAGDAIVTSKCAISGCHNTADAPQLGGGLDLTINATIGSRLVGVASKGTPPSSECTGNAEAYLNSASSPATGLLIQKFETNPTCSASETPPCCGNPMPFAQQALTTAQQQCIVQWATTLTTAAP